jgi:Spy/CpxP family protein refolding chaperone
MRHVPLVLLLAATLGTTSAPPARDRAHTYLMLRVVDALDLTDDKALQMRDILRRADARRLTLTSRRDALDAKLRSALDAKPLDSVALSQLVADTHDVQSQLASLPETTFDEAQKILTVEQQAKLLLFRRDLQGEVRQAIRRRATSGPAHAAHPKTDAAH